MLLIRVLSIVFWLLTFETVYTSDIQLDKDVLKPINWDHGKYNLLIYTSYILSDFFLTNGADYASIPYINGTEHGVHIPLIFDQPTLYVNSGWHRFQFDDDGQMIYFVLESGGDYDEITFTITDYYCRGDAFELFVNGWLVAETPEVQSDHCDIYLSNPTKAMTREAFSSVRYTRSYRGGSLVVIRVKHSPYSGGRASIRVDSHGSVCLSSQSLLWHPDNTNGDGKDNYAPPGEVYTTRVGGISITSSTDEALTTNSSGSMTLDSLLASTITSESLLQGALTSQSFATLSFITSISKTDGITASNVVLSSDTAISTSLLSSSSITLDSLLASTITSESLLQGALTSQSFATLSFTSSISSTDGITASNVVFSSDTAILTSLLTLSAITTSSSNFSSTKIPSFNILPRQTSTRSTADSTSTTTFRTTLSSLSFNSATISSNLETSAYSFYSWPTFTDNYESSFSGITYLSQDTAPTASPDYTTILSSFTFSCDCALASSALNALTSFVHRSTDESNMTFLTTTITEPFAESVATVSSTTFTVSTTSKFNPSTSLLRLSSSMSTIWISSLSTLPFQQSTTNSIGVINRLPVTSGTFSSTSSTVIGISNGLPSRTVQSTSQVIISSTSQSTSVGNSNNGNTGSNGNSGNNNNHNNNGNNNGNNGNGGSNSNNGNNTNINNGNAGNNSIKVKNADTANTRGNNGISDTIFGVRTSASTIFTTAAITSKKTNKPASSTAITTRKGMKNDS